MVTKSMQQIYDEYPTVINAIIGSVKQCEYAKFIIMSDRLAGALKVFFTESQLFDIEVNCLPERGYKFLITKPGLLQKFSNMPDRIYSR